VVIGFAAKFYGGPLGSGHLAAVGPAGAEVGLVAVLEVGVTAAVVAGAANWLLLRHHIRRLAAPPASALASASASASADSSGPAFGHRVLAPVVRAPDPRATAPAPSVVDETDDAGGHRIYYDPWAVEKDE
jgi:hypothetical protein